MPPTFLDIAAIDPARLLAFEAANRAYFESMIDPRDPAFYCVEGVARHIAGLVDEARQGIGASYVIANANDELLGRANLKKIDPASGGAEIGYRIGERYTGQGIATHAAAFLVGVAREKGLRHVDAIVLDTNPASARVLEKSGFEVVPGNTSRPGTRRFRFHFT